MVSIIFGGDICPMGRIQSSFSDGDASAIFHGLLDYVRNADLSVVNLECPLISREKPISKGGGEILGAKIETIKGIAAGHWKLVNLANNHSFDHGTSGLRETIQTIQTAGLNVVGAGMNIHEAKIPFIREINGKRIVIYSMAEQEFSVADEYTAGSNPLDLINLIHAIQQFKQGGNFIVLIHGGKEFYHYPSPEMVRRCRFMVEMGADAVICCHTHCPLPWEIYNDKPIVYGMGNLIFESENEPDNWYEGYLSQLVIADKKVNIDFIPYFQSKKKAPGAHKMDELASANFLFELKQRSDHLKDNIFLENHWAEYCEKQKDKYLTLLFGCNRYVRKLRRFLLPTFYSAEAVQQSLLLVSCETHLEILNTIFKSEKKNSIKK